jgi:hypothetical protein
MASGNQGQWVFCRSAALSASLRHWNAATANKARVAWVFACSAKVLAGVGKSEVVDAEYVYCFRAVGVLYGDRRFFPRSEVPMPIPSSVVRQDQPAAFDLLQHGVKALDNALQAMANVTELIDDVEEADKRSDNDKYLDRRYRKAQAYEALDHLLTTALDRSATLQSRLADYHKASPELAHWLARWQSEDAKT